MACRRRQYFFTTGKEERRNRRKKRSGKRERMIVDGHLYCVKRKEKEKEKFYDQKDYCLILTCFMISASDD